MPLYAYRCTQCGHRFEKIQNFSAEPELECPKCHGVLERPLTAPRLHFKGAGWYVNDYASSSTPASDSGAESGKSTASAETKTPSKPGESTTSAPAAAPAPSAAPASGTTDSKS